MLPELDKAAIQGQQLRPPNRTCGSDPAINAAASWSGTRLASGLQLRSRQLRLSLVVSSVELLKLRVEEYTPYQHTAHLRTMQD